MTTIIVSVLLALGIGGGVMVASSSGGSSGGAAVVAPANPGDSGGSSGGETSYSGTIQAGNMLKSVSNNNIKIVTKNTQVNKSLSGAGLTMELLAMAPNKVSNGVWETNETHKDFGKTKSNLTRKYLYGYNRVNPQVQSTFNLGAISSSSAVADFYDLPSQTKYLGTLNATILDDTYKILNFTHEDVSWTFKPTLALGAKKFGLQYSEFGYYTWYAKYSNSTMNSDSNSGHYTRYGTQQIYMFDTSRQLTSGYQSRYGNTATFAGIAIGTIHKLNNNCGSNGTPWQIKGDINLTFNFNTNKLTGSVALNSVSSSSSWYTLTLGGTINEVSGNGQNFNINSVTLGGNPEYYIIENNVIKPLVSDSSFGGGVIVQGNNPSKDEMVGEIAFAGHTTDNGTNSNLFLYTNLAFGAKKN